MGCKEVIRSQKSILPTEAAHDTERTARLLCNVPSRKTQAQREMLAARPVFEKCEFGKSGTVSCFAKATVLATSFIQSIGHSAASRSRFPFVVNDFLSPHLNKNNPSA